MKLFYKLISQMLIVSMILLPFSAQAGVIGTDQAVASAQDLANRAKVSDFVSRELLEDILESEEEHIDWLEIQLGLVEDVGLQNYLQSQMKTGE